MDYILLIWLADVIDTLQRTIMCLSITALVISLVWAFISTVEGAKYKPKGWYMMTAFMLILLGSIIPQKTTIYTIVAIKAGKDLSVALAENERVQKALKLVDKYLDKELAK